MMEAFFNRFSENELEMKSEWQLDNAVAWCSFWNVLEAARAALGFE